MRHLIKKILKEQEKDKFKYTPKIGDGLTFIADSNTWFVKGKTYQIEDISYEPYQCCSDCAPVNVQYFHILDDKGREHRFSINHMDIYFNPIPKDIQNIDFFGQIYEQEEDELEWARESLRNSFYVPSLTENKMTVWVFTEDTANIRVKVKELIELVETFGFKTTKNHGDYTDQILTSLRHGQTPYMRTSNNDSTGLYSQITIGSSEDTFKGVTNYDGFDDPRVNAIYVR